jgi:lysophospholipase L1-like esterase
MMKHLLYGFLGSIVIIALAAFTVIQSTRVNVYLVGDSTCAEKDVDAFPEMGWGVPFQYFFDSSVKVENHAKNGRSTKTFIEEGRWQVIMDQLQPGDFVLIQFGHNDEIPTKVDRYTTPDQYKANLRKYVADTRNKNAIPILLSPVSRRSFDETGKLTDSHAQYAQLVREVAKSEKVDFIDMTAKSMVLLNEMGAENSKFLFHHLLPGEHPNYPNGKVDDTHFNELGARKMAQLVLHGIRDLDNDLKSHIVKGTR